MIDDPVWSTGTPPAVALTHIFCGEIKDQGKTVEGFHSRPHNRNPTCAKASGLEENISGLRCFSNVAVRDAKNNKWMPRTVKTKHYCFFPESWSIADTIARIRAVYSECKNKIWKNRICGRNYENASFDMIIYLGNGKEVVSSFATPSQEVRCNVNCDLKNYTFNKFIGETVSRLLEIIAG